MNITEAGKLLRNGSSEAGFILSQIPKCTRKSEEYKRETRRMLARKWREKCKALRICRVCSDKTSLNPYTAWYYNKCDKCREIENESKRKKVYQFMCVNIKDVIRKLTQE